MQFFFRHNDLPWNIRKFVHNKLESVNLTHNLKYIDPWAKSLWSHTDIGRMNAGMIGCQVSAIFCSNVELPICRIFYSFLFFLLFTRKWAKNSISKGNCISPELEQVFFLVLFGSHDSLLLGWFLNSSEEFFIAHLSSEPYLRNSYLFFTV